MLQKIKNMLKTDIQVSEEIGMYLDEMRSEYPAMEEIWLIGPRVNEPSNREASWQFVVFADRKTLEGLRRQRKWQRSDVELLIVTDGDRFGSVWDGSDAGSLRKWNWQREDSCSVTYDGRGPEDSATRRQRAVRVR